jgi:hypothetical protein
LLCERSVIAWFSLGIWKLWGAVGDGGYEEGQMPSMRRPVLQYLKMSLHYNCILTSACLYIPVTIWRLIWIGLKTCYSTLIVDRIARIQQLNSRVIRNWLKHVFTNINADKN